MNNSKKININKKIVATLLILFMLLGNISPIIAASGSGTWVAGQWGTYIFTTDNASTKYGVLLRKLTNVNTRVAKTVFCSQHGLDIKTGVKKSGNYYTPTNPIVIKASKIAYFGWYEKYGDYVIDAGTSEDKKLQYVLTQQYIWETLGQSNATFVDSSYQSQYVKFKEIISSKINSMATRPSFDDTTIELNVGDTYTAIDNNGVLSYYNSIDKTVSGVRFQHTKGENTLKITVNEDCEVESLKISDATALAWGLIKDGTQDNDTTIYFEFEDDVQNQIYALNYNDPVTLAFSLKINSFGKLELTKLNTSGDLIDGAIYNVVGPNGFNQDVTVKGGKIIIDKLNKGTYTIKEKIAPYGYLLNTNSYNIEVKNNQTASQSIINKEPTGTIKIIKRDSETNTIPQGDAELKNAIYEVYAKEDICNVDRTQKYYSSRRFDCD